MLRVRVRLCQSDNLIVDFKINSLQFCNVIQQRKHIFRKILKNITLRSLEKLSKRKKETAHYNP